MGKEMLWVSGILGGMMLAADSSKPPIKSKKSNPVMPSDDDASIYAAFVVTALQGGNPHHAESLLSKYKKEILNAADYFCGHIKQKTIYRGVIYKTPQKYYKHHKRFNYISCSEYKDVAAHFADPTPSGFGTKNDLGGYGYVVEIKPPYTILYHHSLLRNSELSDFLFEHLGGEKEISFLEKQKEVGILPPPFQIPIKLYKERS